MPVDPTAALAIKIVLGVACVVGFGLYILQERRNQRGRVPVGARSPRAPVDPAVRFTHAGIRVERIAQLHLPTGAIVACDPLAGPDTPPLGRTVVPGTYPVELAIGPEDLHVAVRVVFADGAPARWEPAGSYGVDAGVGCFMDATTAALVLARGEQLGPDEDYYSTVLEGQMSDARVDHYPVAGRPENCVIVQSGGGDGFYDSYWGLADDGQVLQLVTDFA